MLHTAKTSIDGYYMNIETINNYWTLYQFRSSFCRDQYPRCSINLPTSPVQAPHHPTPHRTLPAFVHWDRWSGVCSSRRATGLCHSDSDSCRHWARIGLVPLLPPGNGEPVSNGMLPVCVAVLSPPMLDAPLLLPNGLPLPPDRTGDPVSKGLEKWAVTPSHSKYRL